jgi:hypothetical protein
VDRARQQRRATYADPLKPTVPTIQGESMRASVVTATQGGRGARKPGILARRRAARDQAREGRDAFEALAIRAAAGDPAALADLPAAIAEARQFFRGDKFERKRLEVLESAVRATIKDDVLSVAEERHLFNLLNALGVDLNSLQTSDPALWEELWIARVNAGRPPVVSNPGILMKRDEVAYGVFAAVLMKEVAVREWRGGSSGVSIPIGLGMRYRVGRTRGRSAVVGTQLIVADSGVFAVTSLRSIFTGKSKTLEFRHDRLVGLEQFADGLRLNVSNRQTASLLRFAGGSSPSLAAALISSCVSRA